MAQAHSTSQTPAAPTFTVARLQDDQFQPMRDQTKLGEPTVFEALAWQYLAGQVMHYWEIECVRRAKPAQFPDEPVTGVTNKPRASARAAKTS